MGRSIAGKGIVGGGHASRPEGNANIIGLNGPSPRVAHIFYFLADRCNAEGLCPHKFVIAVMTMAPCVRCITDPTEPLRWIVGKQASETGLGQLPCCEWMPAVAALFMVKP